MARDASRMTSTGEDLRYLEFRPPGGTHLLPIPASAVLRDDDVVTVFQVAIGAETLRHYAFADRWASVTVGLDENGQPIDGNVRAGFRFAAKCHIATPVRRDADLRWQVDLWLDVLVAADGRTCVVEDEDEFAVARQRGLLGDHEAVAARASLSEVITMVRSGTFFTDLDAVCPFGPLDPTPVTSRAASSMRDFAWLSASRRSSP
jgi:predicted RNA-binding protein associated with RNAse of E/G family